ncbi:MAG TPA: peptide chain release factor N(5)-glutamine methyltransferase [Gallionella sp.]|nr:peptide chain release factor N(5)-glutamine methyltransferase [Gallionella sp.]
MSISDSTPLLTLGALLKQDSPHLEDALHHDAVTARIEVQCLLQAVLGVNRAYLLTHPERLLTVNETARYGDLFARRLNGEPIAYLLGEREFFGLSFKVTPATLIPRPDTELLVELALQRIPHGGAVLDMGTGSGAIALAIAHERPDALVVAVDASAAALLVAAENVQRLQIKNVHLLHSDWFSALSGERFDLIVSNPPYIEADDVHLELGDVRFEPLSALASGEDGLDDIRRILLEAKNHLKAGGWLMFEHGYNQAARVRGLLQDAGFYCVSSALDLSGIERVTLGQA